jgi:hypothetical protein
VPLVVKGYRELLRADARATKETKLGVRRELREVAEPVRRDAQSLALSEIRNMPVTPAWAVMRVGITRRAVYVAPKQKGSRGRGPNRRPNLANLLMDRAMARALAQDSGQVQAGFEHLLDHIGNSWSAGG